MLRTFLTFIKRVTTQTQLPNRLGGRGRRRACLGVERLEDRVTPSQLPQFVPTLLNSTSGVGLYQIPQVPAIPTAGPFLDETSGSTAAMNIAVAPVPIADTASGGGTTTMSPLLTSAPGPATKFVVAGPGTTMAGAVFGVTVTATDNSGNTATGFNGSLILTTSDGQTAFLAGTPTFTNGVGTFTVVLDTAGTVALTATSGSIQGTSGSISVHAGAASNFVVAEPNTVTAGAIFTVAIIAEDAFGNTATSFSGNPTLTSSDGQTVFLTAIPVFSNGVATATAVLDTASIVALTATSGSIQGTGDDTIVQAGSASLFSVDGPADAVIGASFTVIVMAQDAFGNTATNFSGSFSLIASDGQTVAVSGNPLFLGGVASASVTLNIADTLTLTATSGSIQGDGGSMTVTGSDWFSQNMPDTGLQNLARTDFTADGSIGYSDMLGLFAQAEADGTVTSVELQSLQALITTSGAAAVQMPASVQNLTYKVVVSDPANNFYQGTPLGNLLGGSPAAQLQNLVNKWFLGADHPTIYTYYIQGWGTPSYQLASGSLFGSGGPSYQDVAQGKVGDCWLLSSFGVTAANDPNIIQGMFTDDGVQTENGAAVHVWTVCFYHNGAPSYVTVDNYVPEINGSYIYADFGQSLSNTSTVLWVPLLEKAYAQLCASGWNQRPAFNAYGSLDGGNAASCLPIITGGTENSGNFLLNQTAFIAAIAAGNLFTVATASGNASLGIVPSHNYAVLGYDASTQTYTLLNPWGWNNTSGYPGILNLTWAQLTANFMHDGNCTP